MLGLELWFVYSVISAIFVGIYSYTHKIASVRGYSAPLITSYGMGLSSLFMFVTAFFLDEAQPLTLWMITVGGLAGVMFLLGSNLRIEALRYIDATIALPIHKVIGPIFAIILGVVFFSESFSIYEWIGLGFSVTIPLFLISRNESTRQKKLSLGLVLIVISSVFAALVAFVNKLGVDIFNSPIFFGAVTNSIGTLIGVFQYKFRNKQKIGVTEVHYFDSKMLKLIILSSVVQYIGFVSILLAFDQGGSLGIVYTINSLYILIPIVLSIIVYKEHWNMRKVIAIALSIVALIFMK